MEKKRKLVDVILPILQRDHRHLALLTGNSVLSTQRKPYKQSICESGLLAEHLIQFKSLGHTPLEVDIRKGLMMVMALNPR